MDLLHSRLESADPATQDEAISLIISDLKKENNLTKWNNALTDTLLKLNGLNGYARSGNAKLVAALVGAMKHFMSIKQFTRMLKTDDASMMMSLLAVHVVLRETPLDSPNEVNALFDVLLAISGTDRMVELRYAILCEALVSLPDHLIDHALQFYILRRLSDSKKTYRTLEGIAVYLSIKSRKNCASFDKKKHIKWSNANPLDPASYDTFSPLILASPNAGDGMTVRDLEGISYEVRSYSGSSWRKTPHYVWHAIARMYKEQHDTVPFATLWTLVEQKYFGNDASERQKTAYSVLAVFIKYVNINLLPLVFSETVVRDINTNASEKLLKRIGAALSSRGDMYPDEVDRIWKLVLTSLPSLRRHVSFKHVSASVYEMLQSVFMKPPTDARDLRHHILNSVFSLLRNQYDESGLQFVLLVACCKPLDGECDPPLQKEYLYARSQFEKFLAMKTHSSTEFPNTVLDILLKLQETHDFIMRTSWTSIKSVLDLRAKQIQFTDAANGKSLENNEKTEEVQIRAVQLFVTVVLILTYTGTATSADLSEVVEFVDSLSSNKRKKKGLGLVLVEMVLSFATRHSTVLKELCENLVRWFAHVIDQDALTVFYDVLDTKENLSGMQELFSTEEDGVEEDGKEDTEGKEVEEEDDEEDHDEAEDEDDDDEDDEEENEDGDDIDVDNDEEEDNHDEDMEDIDNESEHRHESDDAVFHNALSSVLQVPDSSGSESDTSMTDDQMLALDSHISALFKSRMRGNIKQHVMTKKQQERNAREVVMFAKSRSVDMLAAFARALNLRKKPVDAQIGMCVVSMILPLLRLIRYSGADFATTRAISLIRSEIIHAEFKPTNTEDLFVILHTILQDMTHTNNLMFTNMCNSAALYLCKLIVRSGEGMNKVMEVYTDFMKAWAADTKMPIGQGVFIEFLRFVHEERERQVRTNQRKRARTEE